MSFSQWKLQSPYHPPSSPDPSYPAISFNLHIGLRAIVCFSFQHNIHVTYCHFPTVKCKLHKFINLGIFVCLFTCVVQVSRIVSRSSINIEWMNKLILSRFAEDHGIIWNNIQLFLSGKRLLNNIYFVCICTYIYIHTYTHYIYRCSIEIYPFIYL